MDPIQARELDRLEKDAFIQRLNVALGKIAPGSTAPREALQRLWRAAEADEPTDLFVDVLRRMLEPHWGDWWPEWLAEMELRESSAVSVDALLAKLPYARRVAMERHIRLWIANVDGLSAPPAEDPTP